MKRRAAAEDRVKWTEDPMTPNSGQCDHQDTTSEIQTTICRAIIL